MSEQPYPLRLADDLESLVAAGPAAKKAAAELRRLHGQEQLLTMIGTSPEREMAMKYRINMLEAALTQAIEAMEDSAICVDSYYVPPGKRYLPEVEEALAAARSCLPQDKSI